MRTITLPATAVLLSLTGLVHAHAGAILSPGIFSISMTNGSGVPGNITNRSGLSPGFTSGVTDYDVYVAANPTHASINGTNGWASHAGTTSGTIEFDLGADYTISSFALWNQSGSGAVNDFTLSSALDSGFTSGVTNLGAFTAAVGLTVQTFTISGAGEFVRLQVNNVHGTSTSVNIGEVAFDVTVVPEPDGFAILGAGLLGIGMIRRPRDRTG